MSIDMNFLSRLYSDNIMCTRCILPGAVVNIDSVIDTYMLWY